MNNPRVLEPLSPNLRDFLQDLADAVLVLDAAGQVMVANPAVRQLLGPGLPPLPAALVPVLGRMAAQRVQALLLDAMAGSDPGSLPLVLGDGRTLRGRLHQLDATHWALTLREPPRGVEQTRTVPGHLDGSAARELIGMFWDSPFPATLQNADFRLVAVNDAFVLFSGRPRETLIGLDPVLLMPEEDRGFLLDQRASAQAEALPADVGMLIEQRFQDTQGRDRWFRTAQRVLSEGDHRIYLQVLQDSTAEHAAREQADRSERDLEQWFEMSPLGMVLFDGSGLLVRTNPAFESLVGLQPIALPEAQHALQQLMAWEANGPSQLLVPGAPPIRREGWVGRPGGPPRRLRATLRAYDTPGGHRRYMAAVQDLSAEEERDLARMQIGALMDTAGVGVATLLDARWTAPREAEPPGGRETPALSTALQSISRELVVPESMPEYERLQQALRHGHRAELRYAIRHPELGRRWLLTRVEPGQLASGKRTTSVVTLDVTDQEQARSRNEQLLRELGTVLESSPAGIVHLRGDLLVRCNGHFERLMGLAPGSAAGRRVPDVFAGMPAAQRMLGEFVESMAPDFAYEGEFELPRPDGAVPWVSLSARSYTSQPGVQDVIAVLTDITRLKLQQAELELLARDRELMFSLSDVGIAFVRDGRLQLANEAMQSLTGHDATQLMGLEIGALFPSRQEFFHQWAIEDAALRQGGRWSGERMLRRADGSTLWVQVSKRLVVPGDPGGGIIASYVNVDDRHRAEASLAKQADATRSMLDSVLVGIVTVGVDGIEWMNRSARRMFGDDLAAFIGQPIDTVASDEADHPFRRNYRDTLAEGEAETFECRVRARDGREFWVAGNVVATPLVGAGPQLTYALLDIERRREAEDRTARAQAALQRIIDVAPLSISLYDAQTHALVQINRTAIAASRGQVTERRVGQLPEDYLAPADAATMRADLATAVRSGELLAVDRQQQVGDQTLHWDTRYLPLIGADGTPEQVLLVATDVTEQRVAQAARLEAAIAQRDRLVKEVHHRIKNNLQGVAGLMQQIAQRRPEVADVITEAVAQVQAIAQVYGLQVGVAGPLRVKSIVEAIVQSVQRSFGRPISFAVLGPDAAHWHRWALPEAEAIPIALTLNELLVNAVRHVRPTDGGETEVRCELVLSGQEVAVRVVNPGHLPDGFDLGRVRGGVSGLGLVRALLPRRHARLTLDAAGGQVVATVILVPPGVTLLEPL